MLRRLLDHLLVAPLEAAVADADRPGAPPCPSAISCTSTWRAGSISFSSSTVSSPKAFERLARALLERRRQLAGRHPADPAAAAARARLDHQRVADALRVLARPPRRSPPGRRSTARPARRPSPPAAWPRPCRRAAASRRRRGRRRRSPAARRARRTPGAPRRSPSPPRPPRHSSRAAPARAPRSPGSGSAAAAVARRKLPSPRQ